LVTGIPAATSPAPSSAGSQEEQAMTIPMRHRVAQRASALIGLAAVLAGCGAPAGAPRESLAAPPPVALVWQSGAPDGLRCPAGLAVDALGTLTVVDAGKDRLVQLSDAGEPLGAWGHAGDLPGEFRFLLPPDPDLGAPCLAGGGVAVDTGDGSIVVADRARVQRLDRAGRVVAAWDQAGPAGGRLARPAGVAVDGRTGHVYVADGGAARVHKYDRDGRWLLAWGGRAAFASPAAVAVDGRGRVYVADRGDDRIWAFDGDGRLLAAWGGPGAGDGEFLAPRGVAVDRVGRVYVVDAHRVQVFTDVGVLLAAWPVDGETLTAPGGIAVDDRGLVYVTDWGRGLVLQYRPRGLWPAAAGTPTPRPSAPPPTPGPPATPTLPASMTPTDR
jgi:DNA-binding beta-propeller fold protein YncE